MTKRRTVFGVLVLVQLFFGGLPIAAKIVLREMTSPALVFLRVGGGAAIFYVIHRFTTNERIRSAGDYWHLALYSLLGVSLNQLLYIEGLSRTTATAAQMLVVAGPAITLAVGIGRGTERGTLLKWIGIALAAGGALSLIAAVPPAGRIGNLIILVNVTTYAIYLVLVKGIVRRYHPLTVITWVFIFGTVALAPVGGLSLVHELAATSVPVRVAMLWIILFPTVGAYYLNMWALTHVESSMVSTFVYLQPITTAALAVPMLGEHPSARMIPSALLVATGVAVAIHAQRSHETGPSPADQSAVEV